MKEMWGTKCVGWRLERLVTMVGERESCVNVQWPVIDALWEVMEKVGYAEWKCRRSDVAEVVIRRRPDNFITVGEHCCWEESFCGRSASREDWKRHLRTLVIMVCTYKDTGEGVNIRKIGECEQVDQLHLSGWVVLIGEALKYLRYQPGWKEHGRNMGKLKCSFLHNGPQ